MYVCMYVCIYVCVCCVQLDGALWTCDHYTNILQGWFPWWATRPLVAVLQMTMFDGRTRGSRSSWRCCCLLFGGGSTWWLLYSSWHCVMVVSAVCCTLLGTVWW
jgi:hypothetical protein